ncbi:hypothetical protein HK100_000287 [Physocladia obscura]|uniref:Glutamine synthetase n=1 Tax=Physocladia obscura TaxID=109957 RepID=A0AAD5SYW1_9FUNG|nr:hypothetical protein HK100_000287 [Physocladia obscura]
MVRSRTVTKSAKAVMREIILRQEEEEQETDDGAKFVRIIFTDTCNVNRIRIVPAPRLAAEQSIKVTAALVALPPLFDAVFHGSATGEVALKPAKETRVILPYHRAHALVLGSLFHSSKNTISNSIDYSPFPLDPRDFLIRCIAALETEFGLTLKAGFETEVVFLNQHFPLPNSSLDSKTDTTAAQSVVHDVRTVFTQLDNTVYGETNALKSKQVLDTLDTIVATLQEIDIPVDHFHPESAPGQFEIVTSYTSILRAVDNLVKTRVVIKDIAHQVGNLHATFAPKVFPNHAGTASHVHLSLWDPKKGQNVFPATNFVDDDANLSLFENGVSLSLVAQHFIAGILHHLPALLAVTTPTVMSFQRIKPSYWSGAYQIWGIQNREAPVRVSNDASHFEIKSLDATANPYIALGAIILTGMDGIREKRLLPPPVQIDPAGLSEAERADRGIRRLPENIEAAQALLAQNKVIRDGLGVEGAALFENFLAVRGKEAEIVAKMAADEVARVMIERY